MILGMINIMHYVIAIPCVIFIDSVCCLMSLIFSKTEKEKKISITPHFSSYTSNPIRSWLNPGLSLIVKNDYTMLFFYEILHHKNGCR